MRDLPGSPASFYVQRSSCSSLRRIYEQVFVAAMLLIEVFDVRFFLEVWPPVVTLSGHFPHDLMQERTADLA